MAITLSDSAWRHWRYRAEQFLLLTKPRIVVLAVFCAMIGMFLASDAMVPGSVLIAGTTGIGLLAAAGFTLNCLLERRIDAQMARTRARPMPRGEVSTVPALLFSMLLGAAGALLLWRYVNALTLWLTLATFVGYAGVYTLLLKPATPQNIVIGGASGAMPPLLGWTAVANDVGTGALVLFLLVFVWTPPHFWALALYRVEDYRRSGLPMLPVTHGRRFTQLSILLYSVLLFVTSLLPYVIHMSGQFYLLCAIVLSGTFVGYSWRLYSDYSDALAKKTFGYSIFYLAAIFAALLIDHYLG